ncbi:porin family protein [Flavobacterium crassostreae]|uniref:Outer membrane protein beta-barrel domain-containing protein n=1 Tax=Flavobacterium crassostreae TaxID=1763534 RepID=A0A1B9E3Z2_9FLAO|nr:porin family protein [Flavobacterium crassostreae]OCB76674.1 hypothetical protein LPBF_06925 [Flavobacterium crassostreae]
MKTLHKNKRLHLFFIHILLLSGFSVYSQQDTTVLKEETTTKIDSLYREDQFFFSFTYNTLQNKPSRMAQNKFSTGFSVGVLRDMPINKERTIAFASGLGLTYNNYIQNLSIQGSSQKALYAILEEQYQTNKISQLFIDLPIEFRWRNSTYQSHKFWRVYGGVKGSYLLYDRTVFDGDSGKSIIKGNKDFNKLLYGVYVAAGYNTINLYAYYGLNPLFASAKIEDKNIQLKALNVGLIFYIL